MSESSSPFATPAVSADDFSKIAFDYIIIGGGAGGLPVANRLSENSNVKVGVLEAGPSYIDDPLIDVPRFIARSINNPKYDWIFETVPQEHVNGRVVDATRGKLLGGSTTMNFMIWDRASREEYDAWKLLADPEGAWDWEALLPYFKRSERGEPKAEESDPFPSWSLPKDIINAAVPNDEIGRDGVVKTSYGDVYPDLTKPFVKACNAIGIPTNANVYAGDSSGVYNVRRTIDAKTGKRVTAASAYYAPVSSRSNLKVLPDAQATKILFKPTRDAQGNNVASGVEFVSGGKTYIANVTKEVILAAGAVQTPQLLELSGIGDKVLLDKLGIPTLVDLPGVGENLQDHIFAPIQYILKPGCKTFDDFRNNPEFAAEQQVIYDTTKKGWMANIDTAAAYAPLSKIADAPKLSSSLSTLEAYLADNSAHFNPLQAKQYEIQVDWLKKGELPHMETIMFSKGVLNLQQGVWYTVLLSGLQHPFSRGSIHINTADPLKPPVIDPAYLSNPFDLQSLSMGYRSLEKLAATEPFKSVVDKQSIPPIPLERDEDLAGFIPRAFSSGKHLMGTAPLARRDLGGVVGNDLKVYGTGNLRITDASLIPLPIACHIQATIYAIAERAADLIKQDW